MRLQIALPEHQMTLGPSGVFALSPDGRQLAFAASASDEPQRIWIRSLDSLEARPLPGSETNIFLPIFWSPDSRFIAFDAGGKLKKISIAGGPAETICNLIGNEVGGSWNRDGVIIFGQISGGLMRVSAAGGSASPLTIIDPSHGETAHAFPSFLPDGRHFIYFRRSKPGNSSLAVGSLDAKPEEQSAKTLLATQFGSIYVPSVDANSGQLLFVRDRTLLAQPFDARRLEFVGEPATLAEGLGTYLNRGFFSASTNGVLRSTPSCSSGLRPVLLAPTGLERRARCAFPPSATAIYQRRRGNSHRTWTPWGARQDVQLRPVNRELSHRWRWLYDDDQCQTAA